MPLGHRHTTDPRLAGYDPDHDPMLGCVACRPKPAVAGARPDPVCRSCASIGQTPPMAVTRWIAGVPYCFAHGMDIYCD